MTFNPSSERFTLGKICTRVGNFLLLLLVVAITVPALIAYFLWGLALHLAVWLRWYPRGKDVLLVYSDSPLWHDYLTKRLLPRLAARAVVLNWSARKEWEKRFSLPALVFSYFGGRREFNPLAVVFRPWRRAKIFRFWQPFQDLKHGKGDPLKKMEKDLFREIESLPNPSAPTSGSTDCPR